MSKMRIYESITVEREERGIVEQLIEFGIYLESNVVLESCPTVISFYEKETNQLKCKFAINGDILFAERVEGKEIKIINDLKNFIKENFGTPDLIVLKSALKDLYLFKWFTQMYDAESIKGFMTQLSFFMDNVYNDKLQERYGEAYKYLEEIYRRRENGDDTYIPTLPLKF